MSSRSLRNHRVPFVPRLRESRQQLAALIAAMRRSTVNAHKVASWRTCASKRLFAGSRPANGDTLVWYQTPSQKGRYTKKSCSREVLKIKSLTELRTARDLINELRSIFWSRGCA